MRYMIRFSGRKKGAIGIFYSIAQEVEADDVPSAVLKLYDTYDHIQDVRVNQRGPDGRLDPLTMDQDGRAWVPPKWTTGGAS
jgi:hypothetical protein